MIAALTGTLRHVDDHHLLLQAAPILYELSFPSVDLADLQSRLGQELTLHTIFYLSGDPSRGGMDPTLIGFLRTEDKAFFELFTTVKGIGPKRALRALSTSIGQIAAAIESRDVRFLITLPEIGKRTAEQVVAELAGKLARFAVAGAGTGTKSTAPLVARRPSEEEDAIAGLMALGERRFDAEALLDRVKQANPELSATNQLLREMLRLRGGR